MPSPSTDSTDTMPPIASMLSPNDGQTEAHPLRSELIVEVRVHATDCSKIEISFDFGMPMPLSRISTRGWVLDQSASTRTARAGFGDPR